MICDSCGKESFVIYVKSNPGNICDACEDEERKVKGRPNDWDIIKRSNKQRKLHQSKDKRFGKVLHLNLYRGIAGESKALSRIFNNRHGMYK